MLQTVNDKKTKNSTSAVRQTALWILRRSVELLDWTSSHQLTGNNSSISSLPPTGPALHLGLYQEPRPPTQGHRLSSHLYLDINIGTRAWWSNPDPGVGELYFPLDKNDWWEPV